jgi:hypothetical protein
MKALAAAIERASSQISLAALEQMYRDPFWQERFGTRGRKFAEEDGGHHLAHLVQALLAEDSALLGHYAQWLQSVLTSRGMSTRHLAENFERLSAGIESQKFPDGDEAIRYLAVAVSALEYPSGLGRELQQAAGRTLDRVTALLGAEEDPGGRIQAVLHLSYLADSLALGRPELFLNHRTWMQPFLERHGMKPGRLAQLLAAIGEALRSDETLSSGLKAAALRTLEADSSPPVTPS